MSIVICKKKIFFFFPNKGMLNLSENAAYKSIGFNALDEGNLSKSPKLNRHGRSTMFHDFCEIGTVSPLFPMVYRNTFFGYAGYNRLRKSFVFNDLAKRIFLDTRPDINRREPKAIGSMPASMSGLPACPGCRGRQHVRLASLLACPACWFARPLPHHHLILMHALSIIIHPLNQKKKMH